MKEKLMKNQKEGKKQMKQINERGFSKKMKRLNEHGITLVALVVTIIIMLILAGVAIRLALGENGLFSMSRNATGKYKQAQTNEQQEMKAAEKEFKKLTQGLTVTATVNGEETDITKDNFGKYLGIEVINFKELGDGTETVSVINGNSDSESTDYVVSTKYRLYYIDFENKYGDGAGTIYLKADCPNASYRYALQLDTTSAEETKIKQLNPSLYKDKNGKNVQAPSKENENMQAVTWLLNTEKWAHLKDTVKDDVKGQINYIVGAPSLEMMIDSYNMHYNLTGDKPEPGDITSGGNRKKLFYKYEGTADTNKTGYKVGPETSNDYYYWTANYTVQTDPAIDTMYYPGTSNYYWLVSPSADASDDVCFVHYYDGGYIGNGKYSNIYAFCSLVSLKPSFNLQLEGKVS